MPEDVKEFITEILRRLNSKPCNNSIRSKGITLLLTNSCNFQCVHCFYGAGYKETKNLDVTDKLVDFLKWYKSFGGNNICLTGGEPLLHPHIKQIIKIVKSIGYETVDVLTNGSLITEELAIFFADNNVNIQVSVDGTEDVFEKMRLGANYGSVIQGIRNFKKYSNNINLSFVPTKINYKSWPMVVDLAKRMNINLIHLPFLENAGRAAQNDLQLNEEEFFSFLENLIDSYYMGKYGNVHIYFIDEMEGRLKNNITNCNGRCSALNDNLAIDYKNDLYPCSELINSKFKISNLDTLTDYSSIYKNRDVNGIISFNSNRHDDCKNCFYNLYCAGGCRLNAYLNGNIDGLDPNCKYTKYIFDKILDHLVNG